MLAIGSVMVMMLDVFEPATGKTEGTKATVAGEH
jgi:hypothetical protein